MRKKTNSKILSLEKLNITKLTHQSSILGGFIIASVTTSSFKCSDLSTMRNTTTNTETTSDRPSER